MSNQAMTQAPEAKTGLDPWKVAELPLAPQPHGLGWLSAVGPGVIVLGASIGSGEFLLGPAAFVKYGLSLLWVVGALFFVFAKRLPGAADADLMYGIGVSLFLACGIILLVGRRIERTLEYLNWILVAAIISGFGLLTVLFVPASTWMAAVVGFTGFDLRSGSFQVIPRGADFFLLGAFAAYTGGGGVINLTLSNWARDKGYGMSSIVGYIPAAVGGKKVALAHTGATFEPTPASIERWKGWWRITRVDQWGVYFVGAILGMMLPALLYVTFIPSGSDIRGLGIAAALAQAMAAEKGALYGGFIAVLGVWILFKTQLDLLEGTTRAVTDILWTGSTRIRGWRGGDVRVVYYSVLGCVSAWGIIALRLTQPIVLLSLSANMAGVVFIISSLHLLYVNTRLLPVELRPPLWRRCALVALALFYGLFLTLWLWSLL
jgi:hypothetical protein